MTSSAKKEQEDNVIELLGLLESAAYMGALVLTHDNPDPDALGSAAGMRFFLSKRQPATLPCRALYFGKLSHPQNKTMSNLLDMRVQKWGCSDEQAQEECHRHKNSGGCIIFVDVASTGGNMRHIPGVTPDIIIDHHKVNPDGSFYIKDIRAVGSASAIVASYIAQAFSHEELVGYEQEWQDVATALLIGIKTDTQDLTSQNVTDLDFEMFRYLLEYADREKMKQIINYTIPRYLSALKAKAHDSMEVVHSVAVAGLGFVTEYQRDAVPIVADDILRIEGVETVVAIAMLEDRIVASVRSSNDSIDVNEFCHHIFGPSNSGGKLGSGGANVPLGFFAPEAANEDQREKIWNTVYEVTRSRVFKIANNE